VAAGRAIGGEVITEKQMGRMFAGLRSCSASHTNMTGISFQVETLKAAYIPGAPAAIRSGQPIEEGSLTGAVCNSFYQKGHRR